MKENESQNFEDVELKKILQNKRIIIAVIAVLVTIAIIVIAIGATSRSPKKTVEQFMKSYCNGDSKKIASLLDVNGVTAYSAMNTRREGSFAEKLATIEGGSKKEMKARGEEMAEKLDLKKLDGLKYEITNVSQDKYNKELTKVDCKVTYNEEKTTFSFFLYKVGSKSYIVHISGLI